MLGLGAAVVFMSTVFALWAGVTDGLAALVIIQAGVFADASRQIVQYVAFVITFFKSAHAHIVQCVSLTRVAC